MKPKGLLILATLATVTFNNWLLGPYLNHQLFSKNGSISEFSAVTQPHFWVFRVFDIISGVLLIFLAWFMVRQVVARPRVFKILVGGSAVLGIANIFDAFFSLPCSETLNAGCSIPVRVSLIHYQMPVHAYSSTVVAICYLVLPLAGLIYATGRKMNLLMIFSALAAAVALESLLSATAQYLSQHSFSVRTSGIGQELQMLVLGAWFICWGFSIYAAKTAAKTHKSANE